MLRLEINWHFHSLHRNNTVLEYRPVPAINLQGDVFQVQYNGKFFRSGHYSTLRLSVNDLMSHGVSTHTFSRAEHFQILSI